MSTVPTSQPLSRERAVCKHSKILWRPGLVDYDNEGVMIARQIGICNDCGGTRVRDYSPQPHRDPNEAAI